MKGSIRIFSVKGIQIKIHFTFPLLFVYFLFKEGRENFFFVSIFVLFLFFCVVMHELSHSLMAMRYGVKVRDITLLPVGGVASMERIPENPKEEFAISIVGPASNIALATLLYLPILITHGMTMPILFFLHQPGLLYGVTTKEILYFAAEANVILAIFNLIPAFPMDGGRILRALLARKFSYLTATRFAVGLGQLFSFVFFLYGIGIFTKESHPILMIIAILLYISGSEEESAVQVKSALRQLKIENALPAGDVTISPETRLSDVLEIMFRTHQEDFAVTDNGEMVGLLTRGDIISTIHKYGPEKKARDVMRVAYPKAEIGEPLNVVHDRMRIDGIKAIPVFEKGRLVGLITMEDISKVYALLSAKKN